MRLPWVAREAFESQQRVAQTWRILHESTISNNEQRCSEYRAEIADLKAQLSVERIDAAESYNALLAKYHAMKINGASEPEPITPRVVRERDASIDLILSKSDGRPGLRGQMLKQLERDRALGLPDDEIQSRIADGISVDLSEGIPA